MIKFKKNICECPAFQVPCYLIIKYIFSRLPLHGEKSIIIMIVAILAPDMTSEQSPQVNFKGPLNKYCSGCGKDWSNKQFNFLALSSLAHIITSSRIYGFLIEFQLRLREYHKYEISQWWRVERKCIPLRNINF